MDHPGALGEQDAGCIARNGLGCNIVLGPSEGIVGRQDALEGFPASGRNAYRSGANTGFADSTSAKKEFAPDE